MYCLDIIISCNNPKQPLRLLVIEIPKQVGGKLLGSGFYGTHSVDLQLQYEFEDEVRGAKSYLEKECRRLGYDYKTFVYMEHVGIIEW